MPKITKIEVQKRNKERVNIYIDGEYSMAVNAELIYKENLRTDMEINIKKLQEVAAKEEILRCRSSALKVIERSCKTEKELRDKLKEKNYSDNAIELSIQFLKEYNYLNDNTYAKAFIKDHSSSKGSSRIKYELLKKGISKDIIEENMLKCIDEDIERKAALSIGKKKYRSIIKGESDTYKISGKLYRFILSKGYNYDIVKSVVKEIMNDDMFIEN